MYLGKIIGTRQTDIENLKKGVQVCRGDIDDAVKSLVRKGLIVKTNKLWVACIIKCKYDR
ncbi:MAG: hypothetical protein KatS3mg003_0885 [Candidatus Nitrosocaldaceae archaeon]|nr:MAG: hypothetical protein KatS3mg003_0885 [Candidatus Nitrosocaldaceae archaeon]